MRRVRAGARHRYCGCHGRHPGRHPLGTSERHRLRVHGRPPENRTRVACAPDGALRADRDIRTRGRSAQRHRDDGDRTAAGFGPSHHLRAGARRRPRCGRGRLDVGSYEENDGRGKDRPVLVIGRQSADRVYAVRLTSKAHDRDRDFLPIGTGMGRSGAALVGRHRAAVLRASEGHAPRGIRARPEAVRDRRAGSQRALRLVRGGVGAAAGVAGHPSADALCGARMMIAAPRSATPDPT